MEIKLKENSNLVVKNHSGDTLCSIDEATGNVTGCGTKLYIHQLTFKYDNVDDGLRMKLITTSSNLGEGSLVNGYSYISGSSSYSAGIQNTIITNLSLGGGGSIVDFYFLFFHPVYNSLSIQELQIDKTQISDTVTEL